MTVAQCLQHVLNTISGGTVPPPRARLTYLSHPHANLMCDRMKQASSLSRRSPPHGLDIAYYYTKCHWGRKVCLH